VQEMKRKKRSTLKKTLHLRIFITVCVLLFFGSSIAKSEENNIIIEKNLFSPTRQKWVTPQKGTSPKIEVNKALLPELCGTIVTNKQKVALLRSKQAPQNLQGVAPNRFNKGHIANHVKPGAAAITPRISNTSSYCVGDTINGCMLAKIRENRVRLDCDGELVRLYLH